MIAFGPIDRAVPFVVRAVLVPAALFLAVGLTAARAIDAFLPAGQDRSTADAPTRHDLLRVA